MEHTTAITGFENGVRLHREIYECIRSRNQTKASKIMQQHIENNISAAYLKR
jgi:DNA-binding FadR family transcriptional regulator